MSARDTYEEKLLVKELLAGNEKAFGKLFETYRNIIYAYTLSLLKSEFYAEGIVQEVFLKVWMHRDRLNPELSFKSYLFTIARNQTFNFLQKAANDQKLREEIFYKKQKFHTRTDNLVLEAELQLLTERAINQLPPKRKLIFTMSRNQEKTYEDISKELGISVNTVKNQMSKALETIRNFMQVHGDITFITALTLLEKIG
ncbi:MAG: RNA polymerase sigma factor [Allomuricauda sp.]